MGIKVPLPFPNSVSERFRVGGSVTAIADVHTFFSREYGSLVAFEAQVRVGSKCVNLPYP